MEKGFNLAISCGGTGGHFYPGLALARAHKGKVVVLLGDKNAQRQQKIVEGYGLEASFIPAAPLSKNPIKLLINIFLILSGFFKALKLLRREKINVLLTMGSFTSLPSILAAYVLRIPIFLHDGNARIGKANRILSRFAVKLFCAFEAVNPQACKCPVQTVGMPVRNDILQLAQKSRKIVNKIPVVLIFGGSLGAKSINTLIPKIINTLPEKSLKIIHLTGGEVPNHLYPNMEATVLQKSESMGELYEQADFLICRAGGSTISELTLFGKVALLFPYPYAAEDHQNDNARTLSKNNAAFVLQDHDISADRLMPIFEKIIQKNPILESMSIASKKASFPNAIDTIFSEMETLCKL